MSTLTTIMLITETICANVMSNHLEVVIKKLKYS